MSNAPRKSPGGLPGEVRLTEEQRMLVTLRDQLYEGRWDLFVRDLKARLEGRPYVFEIGAATDRLRQTIGAHLQMIDELAGVERDSGANLRDFL